MEQEHGWLASFTPENCYLKQVTIADGHLLAAEASAAVRPIPRGW